jgi:hypothetical protein
VRPLKKIPAQTIRRKRSAKIKFNWKEGIINFFIGMALVANLALVFFIIRQCSKPPIKEIVIEEQEESGPIQIEVLNGHGVPGIAAKFTDYLREQGFDVVKTDNYESFNILKTVIIDRRGNMKNGIKIAEALGLKRDRVLQEVNEAYLIDAIVVLGKDFRQLNCWHKVRN